MNRNAGGQYTLVAGEYFLKLGQSEDGLHFFCSRDEYDTIWKNYFDLSTDYGSFLNSVKEPDGYLYRAARFGSGIRILRQDVWEMIISFIISQQNNIKRIRKCIETLCERYGKKRKAAGGEYYCFPEPAALAEASEEDFLSCGLGYRSRYIKNTAVSIVNKEVDLEELKQMNYPDAKAALMKLSGVGNKVADCICLFGLHHLEAFPVDVHIKRVLDEHYPEGFPYENFGSYAGVIQQYLFYYDLMKPSY